MTRSGYHNVVPMTEIELELLFQDVHSLPDGKIVHTVKLGDMYHVTGVKQDGKKISETYKLFGEADSVVCKKGRIYLVRQGHKKLIKEVFG